MHQLGSIERNRRGDVVALLTGNSNNS